MKPQYIFILIIFSLVVFTCKPSEEILEKQPLALLFDTDTIFFDTVFTEQVSITKRLKIINSQSNAISISTIRVGGMIGSPYSIIINGKESNIEKNVFLRGNDSILILAKINLDKRNINLPFLVLDSILFSGDKNEQKVYLSAWGRDATYYNGDTIKTNTIWDSTSARFIQKTVFVASGATLFIEKGTDIYARKGMGIVVQGTIVANGDTSKSDKITFNGPRLDSDWKKIPGQWKGISILSGSKNNIFNWVEVNNCETAIKIGEDETELSTVTITNSIIKNSAGNGLESHYSDITMWNTLINNCEKYAIGVFSGGNHIFLNNTIVDFEKDFRRSVPLIYFTDGKSETDLSSNPISVQFLNNIVWGTKTNEIEIQKASNNSWQSSRMAFNIARTNTSTFASDTNYTYNFTNSDRNYQTKLEIPGFIDYQETNFELKDTSIAINKGKNFIFFDRDLKAKPRKERFDIGAYEF
jgi:hypothetical protein